MILGHDYTYVMNGEIITSRFEGVGSMISSAARLPLVTNLVSEVTLDTMIFLSGLAGGLDGPQVPVPLSVAIDNSVSEKLRIWH
jgi:hypothetical protein